MEDQYRKAIKEIEYLAVGVASCVLLLTCIVIQLID